MFFLVASRAEGILRAASPIWVPARLPTMEDAEVADKWLSGRPPVHSPICSLASGSHTLLQLPPPKGQGREQTPSFAVLYYLQYLSQIPFLHLGKVVQLHSFNFCFNGVSSTLFLYCLFFKLKNSMKNHLKFQNLKNLVYIFLFPALVLTSCYSAEAPPTLPFTVVVQLPAAPYTDSDYLSCGLKPHVWLLPHRLW